MKLTLSWICLVLLLTMIASVGPAQELPERDRDVLGQMMRAGWQPVAPGVLQRHRQGNGVETFAIGPEGSRWAVQELEDRLAFLESEYQARRTSDVRRAIQELRRAISRLELDLEKAQNEPAAGATEKMDCNATYEASADAYPLTTAAGVGATASAHFHSDCS